jgi:hypothetical protein
MRRTEALLDEVDVRAAAAYEAGVWRELRWGGRRYGRRPFAESAEAARGSGKVRTLCVYGSGGRGRLKVDGTCRCRLLCSRNQMVPG